MATNSYRLGDADRERLGAPEWMPLELLDVTLDQVTDLSERFGFEMEDWPDVFFGRRGEPEAGWHHGLGDALSVIKQAVAEQERKDKSKDLDGLKAVLTAVELLGSEGQRKSPKWQLQVAVWLALHQSGINLPYDEVGQVAILRVTYRRDEEPGKDDGSSDSPPSPTPEPSTIPPSSTSSLVLVEEN